MSKITPGHVNAFQAVRSQLYDNITLASCTVNREPGVAIVMMEHAGEGKLAIMPLFVAITESMEITFPGIGGLNPSRPPSGIRMDYADFRATARQGH